MIYDIHVHVAGFGSDASGNYLSPGFQKSLAFRSFSRRLGISAETVQSDCDHRIASRILGWLDDSNIDRAVLLAFDAAYDENGTRDLKHTRMVTDNDFVADLADVHEKVLFGASIHPYRRDALTQLERLIERGACLVKWIPSAQNIRPEDPRCFPFYEMLARHRIPLLCHAGTEHTLRAFPNSLNDPRRLTAALERGVTVIAAHCGTRIFLYDRSYFGAWQTMALQHRDLWGDISAFGLITRIWRLRWLLKSSVVSKLLFGSDFPVPAMPLSCVGCISPRKARELRRLDNPFDQSLALMKAVGVPREVFTRAGELLRIPENKRGTRATRLEASRS